MLRMFSISIMICQLLGPKAVALAALPKNRLCEHEYIKCPFMHYVKKAILYLEDESRSEYTSTPG